MGHRGVGELAQGPILVNGGADAFSQKFWAQESVLILNSPQPPWEVCHKELYCLCSYSLPSHLELSMQNLPFVCSKFPTVLSWKGFHSSSFHSPERKGMSESYSLNKVEPQIQEGKGF